MIQQVIQLIHNSHFIFAYLRFVFLFLSYQSVVCGHLCFHEASNRQVWSWSVGFFFLSFFFFALSEPAGALLQQRFGFTSRRRAMRWAWEGRGSPIEIHRAGGIIADAAQQISSIQAIVGMFLKRTWSKNNEPLWRPGVSVWHPAHAQAQSAPEERIRLAKNSSCWAT